MRVIAGALRSRPLLAPPGMDTRPTADRLRETLFNVLTQGIVDHVAGGAFLDLYAGSGAVGIEAVSRGAASVVFVEQGAPALAVLAKNLANLSLRAPKAQVEKKPGSALSARGAGKGRLPILQRGLSRPPVRSGRRVHGNAESSRRRRLRPARSRRSRGRRTSQEAAAGGEIWKPDPLSVPSSGRCGLELLLAGRFKAIGRTLVGFRVRRHGILRR